MKKKEKDNNHYKIHTLANPLIMAQGLSLLSMVRS